MTAQTLPRADRTLIMGVLNVTPDSFSDGGRHFRLDDARAHAESMLAAGADIIDVGGESTRPGASRVDEAEEHRRVIPVVESLAGMGATISVDTMRTSVARAALDAGAHIINDVSAGQADPGMLGLAAEAGAPIILMHWRGHLADPAARAHYDDTRAEVLAELSERIDAARAAGVADRQIIVDPGLGFSKDAGHNWELLAGLDAFAGLGFPLLVAASRKRFIASLVSPEDPAAAGESDRDAATAAITVLAAQAGAWSVRVHEPRASRIAAEAVAAVRAAAPETASSQGAAPHGDAREAASKGDPA